MEYEELIEDIFSRHPSVQVSGFGPKSYKAGLDAMEQFDAILGSPWKSYRIVHVAGTNGKGSVSSMLAASLAHSGMRVGLYTSPHLLDFRERMKVISGSGWEMIEKQEVQSFLQGHMDDIEHLSFFEITTGMAMWWFAQQKVDLAVIEVGLGGRLDSTNIISSDLSIVTSIGLDHCAMLGNTREQIASEKGGIFKKGTPALVWGHDKQTDSVFERCASDSGAELHFADSISVPQQFKSLDMDLQGEYQDDNVRTVIAALQLLGVEADPQTIANTAKITGLHGRWEILCDNPKVICDIGHNPPALKKNFSQLQHCGKDLTIVYGVMADKALDDIAPLMPAEARYILCAPVGSRALPAQELHKRLHELRPDLSLEVEDSVSEAVTKAVRDAKDGSTVYIGGSTFVVAEALPLSICKFQDR